MCNPSTQEAEGFLVYTVTQETLTLKTTDKNTHPTG